MSEDISLKTFLSAIFGEVPEGETVMLSRIRGEGGAFQVRPNHRSLRRGAHGQPWYFGVSTVAECEGETVRRRQEDFRAAYVAVCDDVGTKVPREALTVPPSYVLETSAGNFQYGYLLERCEDGALFTALMKALAARGLTDPACVDRTRVMRVPGSANLKYTPPFLSVVREWHPERRWTVEGLAAAYGLELAPEPDCTHVTADRDQPDPLLDWLADQGMLLEDTGGTWVKILCPWRDLHSGDTRQDAGYAPGTQGFQCFHSHPHGKPEFLEWCRERGAPVGASVAGEALGEKLVELGVLAGAPQTWIDWLATFAKPKAAQLPDCDWTKSGPARQQPVTRANALFLIEQLKIHAALNVHTKVVEVEPAPEFVPGFYAKQNDMHKRLQLESVILDRGSSCGLRNKKELRETLQRLALDRAYHPFERFILERPWDGTRRFDELAASVTVADADRKAWRAFLYRWLIQVVEAARGSWRKPDGSQLSGVLVLVGKQGIGKTRWLGSLVPAGYYREGVSLHLSGHSSRDSVFEALSGALIAELGELETTFRKSDAGALKNFISRRMDMLRLPYGATWEEWPRATVFAGSVNSAEFLVDGTGSRRFWPVDVLDCNPGHGIDLQQLWAEANTWWEAGEAWWLQGEEVALHDQRSDAFEDRTPVLEELEEWMHDQAKAIGVLCALGTADVMRMFQLDPADRRLASEVKALGERLLGKRRKLGGKQRAWAVKLSGTELTTLEREKTVTRLA